MWINTMKYNPYISQLSLGLYSVLLGALLTSCGMMSNSSEMKSGMNSAPMDHSKMGGMSGGSMAPMQHSSSDLGPADADYDLRFIDGMTPHHEGALTMANEVLKKSTRPELKALATGILKAQATEISQLKQWRKDWYPKAPAQPVAWHEQMGHMMPMTPDQISAMRMDMDLGAADGGFDQRFLAAMIPHHEGAIVMAKDLLAKSTRPEMKKLAQDILTSQQAEIDQMKAWQTAWGKVSPKP
jgi:uncharacterized protein (DUF305 family)